MEAFRPLLITYAYNILGTMEEARDVVQDAYLKFMNVDVEKIDDVRAYLIRTVINLSINQKKRQQKIVASYPGPWLPEPVETETADSTIHRKDILSYSLMVLLEKLNPRQRAVFILKEAFDYEHEQIAEVLGISTENSRKLLSRAKVQLRDHDFHERKELPSNLDKYMHAISNGDVHLLEQLLTEDISILSDGGGKAVAFRKPIFGRKRVMALLQGLARKFAGHIRYEPTWINHQPALLLFEGDKLITSQVFSISNGQVDHIFFMRNPDKLNNLVASRSSSLICH